MTNVELDLISNPDMLEMIEKVKRGGFCFVGSERYVESNNHYLEDFDKSKPEDYSLYLDSNNLDGYAMIQQLPYRGLKLTPQSKRMIFEKHLMIVRWVIVYNAT